MSLSATDDGEHIVEYHMRRPCLGLRQMLVISQNALQNKSTLKIHLLSHTVVKASPPPEGFA